MATTNKQRGWILVIVLVGLIGSAAVFTSGRPPAGEVVRSDEAEPGHARNSESGSGSGSGTGTGTGTGKEAHHDDAPIQLTAEQAKSAGITLQTAGMGKLKAAAEFPGEVRFNDDRTTHVVPRLAGVAEAVNVDLGQWVKKGQVLAVIASTALSEQRSELLTAQRRREAARVSYEREKKLWDDRISAQQDYLQAQTALQEADIAVQNALQKLAAVGAAGPSSGLNRFEIRAPFAGTVIEKHLSLGEAVKEDASIFTVSDLSSVTAEFAVAPKDLATVRVGQKVIVSSSAFDSKAEGTISYVGALLGEQTRTARARVTLTNPSGAWRPGLFVTVAVLGENQDVAITVSAEALQTVDSKTVVFKAVAGGFTPVPVKVGRSDGRAVEVLDGLKAGDQVAAGNSFVLKAELGKGSAEHEH